MCQKCSNNSCSGNCNSNSTASMQSQLDSISATLDAISGLTRFLSGHPILPIDDSSDIAQFDLATGKGSGDWAGWGICNGTSYPAAVGNITTPDLRDRFVVGSQGSYAVGDAGGFASITLDTTQMPSHSHAITDPGHTHIITDPGHDHNVTDLGHTHAATAANHQHTFETDVNGDHHHDYERFNLSGSDYHIPPSIPPDQANFSATTTSTSTDGSHTHTGITDMAVTAVTIVAAFTGIDMDNGFTGISNQTAATRITIANTGGGLAHENRPPFYAVLWVKKIY